MNDAPDRPGFVLPTTQSDAPASADPGISGDIVSGERAHPGVTSVTTSGTRVWVPAHDGEVADPIALKIAEVEALRDAWWVELRTKIAQELARVLGTGGIDAQALAPTSTARYLNPYYQAIDVAYGTLQFAVISELSGQKSVAGTVALAPVGVSGDGLDFNSIGYRKINNIGDLARAQVGTAQHVADLNPSPHTQSPEETKDV